VRALLESLARGLVERPERVSVSETREEGVVYLRLRVAEEDRGRVIGRGGQAATALRTLLSAVARRRGEECDLEIED